MSRAIIQLGPFSNSLNGGIIQAANEFGHYKSDSFKKSHLITTLGYSKLIVTLRTYCLALYYSWKSSDLIFIYHATARGLVIYFPLILLLKLIFKPKIVIRKFAGDFDIQLSKNLALKWIFKVLLKNVDRFYFETKFLVEYVKVNYSSENIGFWPNTRDFDLTQNKLLRRPFQKKLIFLSRVSVNKGIKCLLDAMTVLKDDGWTLEVYGPLEDVDERELTGDSVKYGGNLESKLDVARVMRNGDIVILPSFYPSEGYPGVIIESLQLGVPVLVSNWRSLPELVGDGGVVLSEPAIENFQYCLNELQCNYEKYSSAAYSRGQLFNSKIVNARILREICSLQ